MHFSKFECPKKYTTFSYRANKSFTFNNKKKTDIGRLLKFYIVFAANLGVNTVANYFIYSVSGYKLIAFGFATLCGMLVNYWGQQITSRGGAPHRLKRNKRTVGTE